MPENKKEANVDVIKALTEFKNSKLSNLSGDISREKSKAAVLIATIKSKRDALAAKLEDEAKSKQQEQDAQIKPADIPAKSDDAAEVKKLEAVKAEDAAPKQEEKPRDKKSESVAKSEQPSDKKTKSQNVKPQVKIEAKTPFEQVIVSEDGEVRRVYVPPTPTAKPKVQTRVFGSNGYQQPRGPRPQTPGGRPQGLGGSRTPMGVTRMPSAAPQPFPPAKPSGQKGKNGKPGGAGNSNKFDDRTMNKRALLKKGYIVDDRISFDEDGEIVVRNYKINRNRDGGNSSTIVIENAVITTDPVSIKTLSEKIGKSAAEIVKTLFILGIMKTINDSIDFATAELVAEEFKITLEYKPEVTFEDTLTAQLEVDEVEDLDNLVSRPPIITIMGHVDHGKTSLLDYIRKTPLMVYSVEGWELHAHMKRLHRCALAAHRLRILPYWL